MTEKFHHVSVLLEESINALVKDPDGTYVDCTLGGSGHSRKIAERLSPKGRLVGIDQDPAAIDVAQQRLAFAKCKVDIIKSNFCQLDSVLRDLHIEKADGFLFDLGVSSHQLDVADRGFSYMQDAPLDMRMNQEDALSASVVVNQYSEEELARIIYEYGEERWAKRIAKFIVEARKNESLRTTGELVDAIKKAIPSAARRDGPHPAKRTFQAIRIEVNNELNILKSTFLTATEKLKFGGRVCVITFHSLEDRIAKQTFQSLAKNCICPPSLPICTCNNKAKVKIIGKARGPSEEELLANPRARSAKLRVVEKIVE